MSDLALDKDGRITLGQAWCAETLRLRESLWGPLEDAAEVQHVRASAGDLQHKLLARACRLAKREGLDVKVQRFAGVARLALVVLWLAAMFAGIAAALSALGDGSRSVNVLLALTASLGVHLLALLLWLGSLALPQAGACSWLGELWLWLTRKLARGPDAALVPRALVSVLGRNGALRWILAAISHGWWASAFFSLLLTMLAVLSTRRYQFNWETTLLSADSFVQITAILGWLPAQLGFPIPPEAVVRVSNGLQVLPESTQALWSGWLIGCIVVYGLIPRVVALLLSAWLARHKVSRLALDPHLPGYAELRERLEPVSTRTGMDAPPGSWHIADSAALPPWSYTSGQALIFGLELPGDTAWPPFPLPETAVDLGLIDSRPQRQQLLDRFVQDAPARLLVVCDANQTPDRGTLALLGRLAKLACSIQILLLPANVPVEGRLDLWRQQLATSGILAQPLLSDKQQAAAWLVQQETS